MRRRRFADLLLAGAGALLLGGAGCGSAPAHQPQPPKAAVPAVAKAPTPQVDRVAPLLRALLDTTAAGSTQAADARRGLRAGPEVRAFYGAAGLPAWTHPTDSLSSDARAALALLARAPEHGLQPTYYGISRLQSLRDSLAQPASADSRARQQARLELYLSDAVLRFMRDLSRGRLRPYTPSARELAAGPAGQPATRLRAALGAAGNSQVPAVMCAGQPTHREYRELQQALARWLRQPVAPDSIRGRRARYEQAALNLERWRGADLPADSTYLLINIPAYELLVVVGDSVRRRYRVIVGTPATPTPTLSSRITHFTLAPGWHVPRSIATRELLPRVKRDVTYLARHNYALYDSRGRPLDPRRVNWAQVTARNFSYTIRQSAGCDNALGNIVFRFANPYSVYLHDTPTRQLFAPGERALSHGCIRLEEPLTLAADLLRRGGQNVVLPSEAECARQPTSRDVRLRRPMALYVRYATCIAEEGRLRFLPDIYHRDEVLRRALFGPGA